MQTNVRLAVEVRAIKDHVLYWALASMNCGGLPGSPWRAPPRGRGDRTQLVYDKAPRHCSDQMDGFKSTWRPGAHL